MDDPRERMNAEEVLEKKDKIFEDVLNMLVDRLNISPTDIRMDTDVKEELMFDSLELYELVVDIEEAYDIRLPDEDLDRIVLVKDVVELIYTLSTDS
ncbi:MAG: phosphopantetheine-binding protein [Saccharofermentans sp.]|nr:phosphopantetheine-binding protein [Saccharofermentans sp.]